MFTVDGVFSSVGSFNFDLWSSEGNKETNIGILNHETTNNLENEFFSELKSSREVKLRVCVFY